MDAGHVKLYSRFVTPPSPLMLQGLPGLNFITNAHQQHTLQQAWR